MLPTTALQIDPTTLSSDEVRLTRMLKALANPVRFQIMRFVAQRQSCITQEIVDAAPLAQSTISQHLKVLREAGLIQGEVEGPAICYCLDQAGVQWLKEQIDSWLPACCPPLAERFTSQAAGEVVFYEMGYAPDVNQARSSTPAGDACVCG